MINRFEGQYAFLSNFFSSPIKVGDITYPTVEHYFQAQKTLNLDKRKEIARAPTPGKAKRLGRQVQLRPDWENVKIGVMRLGLEIKFSDPDLRKKLLDTGEDLLEEGNDWHDNFWGICHCVNCQDKRGLNNLGKLLMELRKDLKTF